VFGLPGAADFAGGTVVHINAGIAGLVCCLALMVKVLAAEKGTDRGSQNLYSNQ
jgi:ammonia channel protein AmtB